MLDYRTSTAVHEAAHATLSHLLGEEVEFMELRGDREGTTMPPHSPCPLCGATVPENVACTICMNFFEKNDPRTDDRARRIERRYRLEAAVAAAGEIAEHQLNRGRALATAEELETDRDRVTTRASLRHLWQEGACSNYVGADAPCEFCTSSIAELAKGVRSVVSQDHIFEAIKELAEELKVRNRMAGADIAAFLNKRRLDQGSLSVDELWPHIS